jgi:hypothetical protein
MFKKLARVAIVAAIICAVAIAGSVYDRAKIATATTTGAGTWTNAVQDANIELVRINTASWPSIDTITVNRVTGDTTPTTGTVATLVITTSGGSTNLVDQNAAIPRYMKAGDKLVFTSANSTGGTIYIEYLVQRH